MVFLKTKKEFIFGQKTEYMKNYTIEKFLTSIGLVLLCFFVVSNKLYASHAMGVDLTYQSKGNNSFLVRLKFFRDCNGIVPGTTVTINIRSASKGSNQNMTLSQVNGAVDITPVCPSSQTRCENASSAYPFGVQQYVYEGTVTLTPAIDYILSFSLCCRNASVTTLTNPGGQNIYVETLLNSLDAPTNNSPQFVNYPVPFFCVNQPTKYTHGVVESDGDILEFSLVNAKQGQGADVTYANGYSGIAPVTTSGGMSINSATGELVFTPTAIQSGVISIRVKEYRMISGFKTLIGEVVRDMQFAIIDCLAFGGGMNTIPVVSGVNGTATSQGVTGDYSITARAGTSLCFNMASYDAQSSVLSMTWNQGISGGTFSVNSAGTLATFCWQPTTNDIGLHFFSVDVKDDNCPVKGINTYTFTVNIVDCPTLNTAPPNVTIVNSTCGAGCVIGGGSISAPTGSPCPDGAVLEYQVNGGAWTTTLPTYNQTGPAQSIKTRCSCSSNPATVSPESNAVLTVPVTAPSLTVPANGTSTVACLAQAVAPTLPVVNNCVGEPITPTGPVITNTPNPLSCEGKRTYTYTYTCGSSSATWSYEYTVERESFTLPANGMSTVNSPSLAIAPSLPTVLSNCGETLTPTGPVITNSPNPLNCEGTRTYSYTYTDCEGNTAVWSYEYTIIDNVSPTITCPANITVNNSAGQCGAVVTFTAPVGADNCAGAITTQTAGLASGSQFPVGVTTNTFEVKASNGQTATCSFTVTVVDAEAPTITCPANITVNNSAGQCGAVVTFTAPVGADNCAGAITTQTAGLASGSQFPVGVTTNTFQVKASNGQTTTCSFTVTVVDAEAPTITCPSNIMVCETAVVTYIPPIGSDNCLGSSTLQIAGLASGTQFPAGVTTNTFEVKASNGQTSTCSFTVTVTPRVEAMISGTTTVCQNSSSPVVVFTGSNGLAPYTFNYKINGGATQMVKTTSGNSVTVPVPTSVAGVFTYTLVSVVESSSISCSQNQNSSVEVKVQGKPTITLTTFQQTLNEGNSQIFCDIDANPVNVLQFGVTTGCVVGTPVWRVQIGGGAWSEWSSNPPVTQSSNNQPYRYEAACDANCPVTYTSPIEVKINYRASTPQQVSLVADGVTVNEGESKEVCNVEGSLITFNATCATGEVVLYSVDGGNYSSVLPTQLIDGQFHNYRVRCRKSDGMDSCIESESGTMQLKITNGLGLGQVPVANLNVTSGCGTPVSFSGTASCGSLATVWYNASTNVALPTLPSQSPTETTSYYARCQAGGGCLSEKSNVVTFTVIPVSVAPVVTVSAEVVCTGQEVTVSTTCPAGATPFWNTGVQTSSFKVSFTNVTKQSYWVRCNHSNGCQSAESLKKDVYWNAFVVTLINVGESKSAVKTNDRNAWSSQFITQDGGPELAASTQVNPTLYYVENPNKLAPRYWTINVDACALGTNGSLTFDLLATPETGVPQSFNTHENNAPYFMYANREGWTELYAQNHPAYGFYQDNGVGGNVYDRGLPKGLYKLGVRYWDQKGWGSLYPSTRKAQGNVLAYQEYWFRIQSKSGVGEGAARFADARDLKSTDNGFAQVIPNPVTDRLRVKVSSSKGQTVTMTLLDVWGREVLQRQFLAESNAHLEEVAAGHLSNGSYLLKVSTEQNQATLKVLKMK